jgi:ERF superfamily
MEKLTNGGEAPAVYGAIHQVSAAMSKYGIDKGNTNTQQGFNFRGIDDVLNALAVPLVEAKLLILPRVVERVQSERVTKSGGTQYHVVLRVDFLLTSARDGSSVLVTFMGEAADTADKATSKAMSMAYKYMAFDTFCIPVKGLDDADAETPAPSSPKPKAIAKPEPLAAAETLVAEVEDIRKRIAAATTASELAALKTEVAKHAKAKGWQEIKTLYTDHYKHLQAAEAALEAA